MQTYNSPGAASPSTAYVGGLIGSAKPKKQKPKVKPQPKGKKK